jgi:hypothetical protein
VVGWAREPIDHCTDHGIDVTTGSELPSAAQPRGGPVRLHQGEIDGMLWVIIVVLPLEAFLLLGFIAAVWTMTLNERGRDGR